MAENQPNLFDSSEQISPAPKKKKSHKPQETREAVIKRILSSADIKEDDIERLGQGEKFDSILELLLRDQTRGQRVVPIHEIEGNTYTFKHFRHYYHILWATDDYRKRGEGYYPTDEIHPKTITNKNNRVVRPRAVKSQRSLLPRGYATHKTTSLMKHGSDARTSSTKKTKTILGRPILNPFVSPKPKAAHGSITLRSAVWNSVAAKGHILLAAMIPLPANSFLYKTE